MPNTPSGGREHEHFTTYETHRANFIVRICILLFLQPGEAVSEKVLKSYCWMYSTFNIPGDFEGQCARKSQSDSPVYNSYYQWVSIFLVFQAFLFYLPRVVWLMSEGGKKIDINSRIVLMSGMYLCIRPSTAFEFGAFVSIILPTNLTSRSGLSNQLTRLQVGRSAP